MRKEGQSEGTERWLDYRMRDRCWTQELDQQTESNLGIMKKCGNTPRGLLVFQVDPEMLSFVPLRSSFHLILSGTFLRSRTRLAAILIMS